MCEHLEQVGSTYYFRRIVPRDLVGYFTTQTGKPRSEWKYSLRTKDRDEAKRRKRRYEDETDGLIDEARRVVAETMPSDKADGPPESRGSDERAEALAAVAAEKRARYEARRQYRVEVEKRLLMSTAEMTPQEAAWVDVMRERGVPTETLQEAAEGQQQANRALEADTRGGNLPLSIMGLFDRYAASGAPNANTARRWRGKVSMLIEHLGHDDARRVTRADLNGWTAALIEKGLAKKTIVDGYLPAVRSAFAVAYEDGAIPSNPAASLKVRGPKPVKLRERDLTDEEATTILRASLEPQSERLSSQHALARRWVPWLCAYTGARVGEITQLRAKDIVRTGDFWCIHITPEAGSVKTDEARLVPLHSHLVEQGVLGLAKAGDETPLFYSEGAGSEVNPGSKLRASDLARWVRSHGVTAPQPNHGWRHRFKTQARVAGIPEYLADKIQGHAAATQGRSYGSNPLELMRDAIEKLSRYSAGP